MTRLIRGTLALPRRCMGWCLATPLRIAITGLAMVSSMISGTVYGYSYAASPTFCKSCHHMDPYYESWEQSTHKNVACVQCHFKPGLGHEFEGKWVAVKQLASAITGRYSSMPYAEVSDQSCLRSGCHDRQELDPEFEFSTREIKFKHLPHLDEMRRGIQLTCSSCHHHSVLESHFEVDRSACFLCHFKPGDSAAALDHGTEGDCNTCHGPPEESRRVGKFELAHAKLVDRGMSCVQCHSEIQTGRGEVDRARCISCHNQTELVEQITDVGKLHLEHVSRGRLHCYQCHDIIQHGTVQSDDPTKGAATPTGAVLPKPPPLQEQNCARCHEPGHGAHQRFFAGVGGRGVDALPNDMHAVGMDCVACHRDNASAADPLAQPRSRREIALDSCRSCHGEGYRDIAETMSSNLITLQKHLSGRAEAITALLARHKSSQPPMSAADYRRWRDTRHNLELLTGTHPAHNPNFALQLLRHGDRGLRQLEAKLGLVASQAPPGLRGEDCMICHSTAFATQPEMHGPIQANLCTACHQSHDNGRHQPRVEVGSDRCLTCHQEIERVLGPSAFVHQPVLQDCGICHQAHTGEHQGRLIEQPVTLCSACHEHGQGTHGPVHGALAKDEGCKTCHVTHGSKFPSLLRSDARSLCVTCHDKPQRRRDGSIVAAVGNQTTECREDTLLHGAIRDGNCTGCHDPHGTQNSMLLRAAYPSKDEIYRVFDPETYALCMQCHEVAAFEQAETSGLTRFRNGSKNLHFIHVNREFKGRSCRICHTTHVGENADHVRQGIAFGETMLNIDYQRHVTGGKCVTTCHVPRGYDRIKAIPLPPAPGKTGKPGLKPEAATKRSKAPLENRTPLSGPRRR